VTLNVVGPGSKQGLKSTLVILLKALFAVNLALLSSASFYSFDTLRLAFIRVSHNTDAILDMIWDAQPFKIELFLMLAFP
jgi:hypothetical protein